MNEEKAFYYTNQILKYFLDNNVVTISQMAKDLILSEKTIRTKIDNINYFIKENNLGEICKKPRVGVWLNATDQQKVQIKNYIQSFKGIEGTQGTKDRFISILSLLLRKKENTTITIQQIANDQFISVPTLLKVINECREWLKAYDITLEIVRNKGVTLIYDEKSYRLAIKEFISKFQKNDNIKDSISFLMPGLDIEGIQECIIKTEKEWKLGFADESYNQILVLLCLAVSRNRSGQNKGIKITKDENKMLQNYNELDFATSVIEKVQNKFKMILPIEEIEFLSIQLLCSKTVDSLGIENNKDILKIYDEKLQWFVAKIIEVVSDVLNIDLTEDVSLFNGLVIHIRPALFRMKYEKQHTHQIKDYIKSEFPNTFRVSWLISVLFEEYYNVKISDDELSYITLYIQTALERNKRPLNIILVSKEGMGFNQLLCLKIKQYCPSVKDITVVSYHDFNIKNYKSTNVILTTVDLKLEDERVVYIGNVTSNKELHRVNHELNLIVSRLYVNESKLDVSYHSFFEPDLIFINLKCKAKEEVLKILCKKLEDKGYVTKKYLNTVLEREKLMSTTSVSRVAIPHGNQNEINQAKVVVATLEKPIVWDGVEEIDIVFLIAVKMSSEFEIKKTQLFYKQYIKLVGTEEDVESFKSHKNNESLYKYLIS